MPIIDRLLALPGVDAAAQDNQAIIETAGCGHVAVLERLLAVPGVDATARKNEPIIEAARNGRLAVVERLLQVPGVDVTAQNNKLVLEAARNDHVHILNRVLSLPGVDASIALQHMISENKFVMVECLLQNSVVAARQLDNPQQPVARHLAAVRLCIGFPYKKGQMEMFRSIWNAYRLAYTITRDEVLPVGVSELVCGCLSSPGLAQYTLNVQRHFRTLLNELLNCKKSKKKKKKAKKSTLR
eukprot:TRINITY_DN1916_c0_g1_i2.p1 TRINITY_DN1916_c0_g1~~TRINITY_DN1916_c0_g1_i2.p1  ORF type:complete len:242 (+),score=10.92 TRINITY_DN1916_c0_g1_i2:950-1675(+)